MARPPSPDPDDVHGAAEVALVLWFGDPAGLAGGLDWPLCRHGSSSNARAGRYASRDEITSDSTCIYGRPHGSSRPLRRGRFIRERNALSGLDVRKSAAALLHRACRGRDRKFKPLALVKLGRW
jgi:hypothetical protein